jgi:uncharacterized RDD family membrane protein YckC
MVVSAIWDILGISQTTDIRQIKKAYSKQLKHNKPDEKPESFQRLHQAYKAALHEARWLAEQLTTESHGDLKDIIPQASDMAVVNQNNKANIEIQIQYTKLPESFEINYSDSNYTYQQQTTIKENRKYQAEIDRILSDIETIIHKRIAYDANSWKFVLESQYILEQDFFDQLSLTILWRIAKYYNEEEYKEQGDFRIDTEVLFYLNAIFRWDLHVYDYSSYLQNKHGICQFNKLKNFDEKTTKTNQTDITSGLRGAKSIKKVVHYNNKPFKYYYYGGNAKRVLAMALDILIVISIVSLINLFSETVIGYRLANIHNLNEYMVSAIYFIGTWVFESSAYQATPGKRALGLRVINKHQGRLNYLHGLIRITVFTITCIGFYITALMNSWLGGKFIHDRFTKSYVMDLARTRKEQKTNA